MRLDNRDKDDSLAIQQMTQVLTHYISMFYIYHLVRYGMRQHNWFLCIRLLRGYITNLPIFIIP